MNIYKTICYRVEDMFLKLLTKKEDSNSVKDKVERYRAERERALLQKKEIRAQK